MNHAPGKIVAYDCPDGTVDAFKFVKAIDAALCTLRYPSGGTCTAELARVRELTKQEKSFIESLCQPFLV